MDLTFPIAAGIILSAYKLSEKSQRKKQNIRKKNSPNEKFNGKNIYESNRFDEVNKEIQSKANKSFNDSKNFKETNKIPPFMNSLCNTHDCSDKPGSKILPKVVKNKNKVSFFGIPLEKEILVSKQKELKNTQSNSVKPLSLLTGEELNLNHNNMVPFFKGSEKQDMRIDSNTSILEHFSGEPDTRPIKNEVDNLFKPQKENIYGSPLFTDKIDQNRYYQSGIKNNVGPVAQLKTKPLPPDVVRPIFKSIDQLRTTNNPKNSYKGRTLDGQQQSSSQRGIVGVFQKNKPDTYYKNNYSLPGSSIQGAKLRENFDLKCTNRITEENYKGPVKSIVSKQKFGLSNQNDTTDFTSYVSDPHRNNYKNDSIRNASAPGEAVNDYGKCSFIAPPNERDTTSTQHILNSSRTNYGNYLYLPNDAKTTHKENALYEYTGNAETLVKSNELRDNYENYNPSFKEDLFDQNNYTPGPQYQHNTLGSNDVNLTRFKDSPQLKNYTNHFNPTYNNFNNDIGLQTTNNLRNVSEHDHSNRFDPTILSQLNNNPYVIQTKKLN